MSDSLAITDIEGGSGKSWKPEQLGDQVKGKVVSAKRVQQTDFTTGEPLEWSNGDPKMQTVIELQTDLEETGDDDGIRSLWLKGGKNYEAAEGEGTSGEVALADAAKAAGATSIEVGGELAFKFTGRSKPTTRGYQPARLYRAKYDKPVESVSASELGWDD